MVNINNSEATVITLIVSYRLGVLFLYCELGQNGIAREAYLLNRN